jgi:hypothetical protein
MQRRKSGPAEQDFEKYTHEARKGWSGSFLKGARHLRHAASEYTFLAHLKI